MNLSRLPFIQKYLYFLVHLKGVLVRGFSKKYFSQGGEDVVLQKIFANQNKGFYVDVGAYHPFHYSNTFLLYKRGWKGINIDPNPSGIALFKLHRRRDKNVNSGVALEREDKRYYIFNHQSCNTFSEEQKEAILQRSFMKLIGTKSVPCVPLQDILDQHVPEKTPIDLLNVDVEGMNMQVLQTIDWSRAMPKVICIEDDDFDFNNSQHFGSEIFSFLSERSYQLHAKVGLSCVYVLK